MSRSRMRRTATPSMPGNPKRVQIGKGPARATDYERAIRDVVLRRGFPVRNGDDGYYGAPIDLDAADHIGGRGGSNACRVSVPDTAVVDERSIARSSGSFTDDSMRASLYLHGAACACGRWKGAWAYEASLGDVIREVVRHVSA